MQGVYGYGMDIGIIEPSLPAEPLDAHNSPVSFPQQFPQASPAVPAPSLQLSARGTPFVSSALMPCAAASVHLVMHAAFSSAPLLAMTALGWGCLSCDACQWGLPTAGQQLVTAADSAIANALEANEKTRQSMARYEAANAAASDPEAALDATPKQRKKRSALDLPVLMQSYASEVLNSQAI